MKILRHKKAIKKLICMAFSLMPIILLSFSFFGCVNTESYIIATLFPQYDFARIIAGDRYEVKMLLRPASDIHNFDPTVADLVQIANAELLLYSDETEVWAKKIKNIPRRQGASVNISEGAVLLNDHDHDDHEHDHDHGEFDMHYWLDPDNARIMVQNILTALKRIDSDSVEYYEQNAAMLLEEIDDYDRDMQAAAAAARNHGTATLVFGGKFAYKYFLHKYGLDYVTAYSSCDTNIEPSIMEIFEVERFVKRNGTKIIFFEELSEGRVAKKIAADTGAEAVVFHTAHNVSTSDFRDNLSFCEIMRENIQAVKRALVVAE